MPFLARPLLSLLLTLLFICHHVQAEETAAAGAEKPAETESQASEGQDDPLAGHSFHGEVFNEGPRQAAYLMGGTGDVHFPATCKSNEVQQFIDQGLGQVYGFWYFESERSFRQAAFLDPECAIAYWGMAVANRDNEKRARGFIEKAVEHKDKVTPREKKYIDAWAAFLKPRDEKSETNREDWEKKRRQALVKAYEQIIHEFKEDLEAKSLLGLAIYENKSKGIPISSYYAVDALLNDVLEKAPLHPVHHFRIHLWDYEKPENALNSAALCGTGSPSIAHMWHMPGHIYSRVKRYHEAVWQQEASARVDHAHMMRDRVLPDQIHNFAHNNEWLIRNLIFIGHAEAGIDLAKNMLDLPQHPKYNHLGKRGSYYYGRMRLFDVLTEFELWPELLSLADTRYLEPTDDAEQQVKRQRWIGVARFRTGDFMGGCDVLMSLKTQLKDLEAERDGAVSEAEEKARGEKKSDEDIKKAAESARRGFRDKITPLTDAVRQLEGEIHIAHGAWMDAWKSVESLNGIDRGWLAELQLRGGEADKAVEAVAKVVKGHPQETIPLARQIWILDAAGKADECRKAFEELRQISETVSLKAPVFARLTPIAEKLGYGADWRIPRKPNEDFGDRPELASLGPFRWEPGPAAGWTLTDHEGKAHSLDDFRGKPVVVIFYLGFGCLHCAEQLQAFVPKAEEFSREGIALIAISSDDMAGLKQSHENYRDGQFPFPLVSDAKLEMFKAYRCYDDFESQALHGVFVIDENGLVRWQDISYEPFMDIDFVLKEAKRQLRMPGRSPDVDIKQAQAGRDSGG